MTGLSSARDHADAWLRITNASRITADLTRGFRTVATVTVAEGGVDKKREEVQLNLLLILPMPATHSKPIRAMIPIRERGTLTWILIRYEPFSAEYLRSLQKREILRRDD